MTEPLSLERIIEITPAWDKRSTEPGKNYGVHCCDLRMVLKGPKGAVQFVMSTGWLLPHVKAEQGRRMADLFPTGVDVGYHSPVAMYEGHKPIGGAPCPYVDGGVCYYDGSGLRADKWMNEKLIPGGSDTIWKALEEDYTERFESEAKR